MLKDAKKTVIKSLKMEMYTRELLVCHIQTDVASGHVLSNQSHGEFTPAATPVVQLLWHFKQQARGGPRHHGNQSVLYL